MRGTIPAIGALDRFVSTNFADVLFCSKAIT
jgi:hypothetical protein